MTQTLVREQAGSSDPAPVAPGPGRPRSTPSRPRRSLTMPITLQVLKNDPASGGKLAPIFIDASLDRESV